MEAIDRVDLPAAFLAILLVPEPIVVAVIWGGAVIMSRPHRLAPMAAIGWLLAAWLISPATSVWHLASYVAAGMVAGVALGVRWRLDLALGCIIVALLPLTIWSMMQVPVGAQADLMREEMAPLLEEAIPQGADPAQREQALAAQQKQFDQLLDLATSIYPFVLVVGLLIEGVIILVLIWLLVRIMGWALPSWRPPPFGRWRMPFYLVWVLAVGLGLLVTRRPLAVHAGLNVALLAAFLLSIQGIAVQFHATARLLSPLGRVVFWTVTGLFLTPVVMPLGVVLGLADQWLDLRGLDRVGEDRANDDEQHGG
jgi:hypothetical protein